MPTQSEVPPAQGAEAEWNGTLRYQVVRRLGEGGMGVVYEALDRERNQTVALKTLRQFSPSALYRFKQEFRTLTGVVHPNLVHLYELIATDAGRVFFTMELVPGASFLSHVWRFQRPFEGEKARTNAVTMARRVAAPSAVEPADASGGQPGQDRPRSPADIARLMPALTQLVSGVDALHSAGKLHRDIKPSNVLVTPEGRVVLLDFGVATDLGPAPDGSSAEREVVGTALYMAPEQAADTAPTTASDWYSVGVMLYEALVGRPPFAGPAADVLARKRLVEPAPPSHFVVGVPPELDAICCALLRASPGARPGRAEIVRMLGEAAGQDGARSKRVPRSERPGVPARALVGREEQQRALREAFELARDGRLVTVRVGGGSGMGKSALVQRFVDDLVERGEAAVLRGRVYERESMPYKALDSVVDALSRHLLQLTERDTSASLPDDLWALARLFPVLRRVDRVADMAGPADPDPAHVIRRRAISAFRQLLVGLATVQPLVVYIDDAHWGDVDSAALLFELIRPPFDAAVLVVLTYREDEAESSAFLIETRALWPLGTEVRDLPLRPLAHRDARDLALSFMRPEDPGASQNADAIARESGGSPLLVEELSRGMADSATRPGPREIRLEAIVVARMATLRAPLRRFLELVALSARPLSVPIAAAAAGVGEHVDEAIAVLREQRFLRVGFRDGHDVVEIAHDRIREILVARLSDETLCKHHRSLASALEPTAESNPEALALHLFGAGDNARAAEYAERAAEQATVKLAFGQAARLYRLAVDAAGETSSGGRRLRLRLADVYERAGRGAEAAAQYAAVALSAQGLERMELERKAAEQLLLSGRVDEGAAALDRILVAAGMRGPRTLIGALAVSFVYRALLLLVGFRYRDRDPAQIRGEDHLRIEALYAVVVGLSFVHVVYGMCAQARHLFVALRAGDRFQVFRAAVVEATNSAAQGGSEGAREKRFARIVHRLVEQSGDPQFRAFAAGVDGQRAFLHGRWQEARELLDHLHEDFRGRRAGWFANWHLFNVYALGLMGELAEARRRCAALLADAEQRGDLYSTVNLRIGHCTTIWLAVDDVEGAEEQVRAAMASWSQSGFFLQHYRAVVSEAQIALYVGDGQRAYDAVERGWGPLRRSFLMNVQYLRADAYFVRARCALASASGARRAGRLAEAARLARKLERERMPWVRPLAALVRAGVASAYGDRPGASRLLRLAAESADAAHMGLHSSVARLRLGNILGGPEGDALIEQARAWMATQEIRMPERIAAMLAPGFAARE